MQEIGIQICEGNAVFTLNTAEWRRKEIVLQYSSVNDEYLRHSGKHSTLIRGWKRGRFASENITRIQDGDKSYLGLENLMSDAFIAWKFDFKPFIIMSLAITNTCNEGAVQWRLTSMRNDGSTLSDVLEGTSRPLEMHVGSSELILTATLKCWDKEYDSVTPKIFVHSKSSQLHFNIVVKLTSSNENDSLIYIERESGRFTGPGCVDDDSINYRAISLANFLYSADLDSLPKSVAIVGRDDGGRSMIMKMVEEFMRHMQEEHGSDQRFGPSGWDRFALILSMLLFHQPPSSMWEGQKKDARTQDLIVVNFNATGYNEPAHILSGVLGAITDRIRDYAGSALTNTFRMMNSAANIKNSESFDRSRKPGAYKRGKHPRWRGFAYSVLFSTLVACTILGVFSFYLNWPVFAKGLFLSFLGLSLLILVIRISDVARGIAKIAVSLLYPQSHRIHSSVKHANRDVTFECVSKLKDEVTIATTLLNWISWNSNKRIRVLIMADNFDDVVDEIEVCRMLRLITHDSNNPFLLILGTRSADRKKCANNFHSENFREMTSYTKVVRTESIKSLTDLVLLLPDCDIPSKQKTVEEFKGSSSAESKSFHRYSRRRRRVKCSCPMPEHLTRNKYRDALLSTLHDEKIIRYISDGVIGIQRLCNLLCLSAELVKVTGGPLFKPREVVLWTVLLDQWPYRAHYILWFIKHILQRQEFGWSVSMVINTETRLKEIYPKVRRKMAATDGWEILSGLDTDPQLFLRYLCAELKYFKVEDYYNILPITVNIDTSLIDSISHDYDVARSMIAIRNKELDQTTMRQENMK